MAGCSIIINPLVDIVSWYLFSFYRSFSSEKELSLTRAFAFPVGLVQARTCLSALGQRAVHYCARDQRSTIDEVAIFS